MVSILVKNGMILTSDSRNRVIDNGGVAIEGQTIIDVGTSKELEEKYSADFVLDAGGKIVIPGMVSCHSHMYGIITHGIPLETFHDKRSFVSSLEEVWWPYIEDQLTQEEIYAATLASSMTMARNGITCVSDILEAPNSLPGVLDKEAEAIGKIGIRGILSVEASQRISDENAELATKENLEFISKWNKKDALIKGKFCTHTTFSCSQKLLRKVRALADQYGGGIQIHLEESEDETMLSHAKYRKLPVQFYDEIGFLGPDVLAAQCCHIKNEEIDILRKHDVKISHQAMSNSGLGSVAPVVKFLTAGLTVGLGAEHYLDMFELMRFTFLLHKANLSDPSVMSADQVFRMATIDGCNAIGYGETIGSLEPNKKADIVIVDLRPSTPLTPENAINQLVDKASGSCVNSVIVNGKMIIENGKILTAREEEIRRFSREIATSFWEKVKGLKGINKYRCR